MYYYEVNISSQTYHGHDALTYTSELVLVVGSIVLVPMRARLVRAVVVGTTSKPQFAVKPIAQLLLTNPLPKVSLELMIWLKDFYPAPLGSITSQFIPPNLLRTDVSDKTLLHDAPGKTALKLPSLTNDQKKVLSAIKDKPTQKTWLLHGDTGTGKTRVYVELIKAAIAAKTHCLVLTPEIGLTSPLAHVIANSVAAETIVIHSGLTAKERRVAWLKVLRATEPLIVVGPRSALFAPFSNLGVIIVDEAHDTAYKQEQSPYYHALRVASQLARLHQATLIFGSATPLITEYYLATQKHVPVLRMQQLAAGLGSEHAPPNIVLVNQTDRTSFSKNTIISDQLIESIRESINKSEQSLVFLNRRGTARLVACQNCGWQALCPNCDLPLTYHGDKHIMRCHTCGHKEPIVTSCPVCSGNDILFKSAGTKAVADSIARIFPHANVQRFDTDNLKTDSLDSLYEEVQSGAVDILVGTQVLIKGHDLPKLSTVGIIAADASLNFPDYTAEEQTYQLLTQVIGRVGRGHRASNVVIQTFNSEGPVLQAAISKSWDAFYKQQLVERERYNFPPFCFVLKLVCKRKSSAGASRVANAYAEQLRASSFRIQILGPTPSFIEKSDMYYSWQIIVKSKRRAELLHIIKSLPANWSYDIDPINLL